MELFGGGASALVNTLGDFSHFMFGVMHGVLPSGSYTREQSPTA